ncbi:hypothetical protein UFOVP1414_20 [uncultured Caudovirales phage]|uniref:Uncharacterized protein n=1 Tax=uncultured Caudovirales phage TaxID=2100421 RepID=A0A6J5M863_9CAUD|nr:hypothetical protein UFOVP442_57 [uncultured Caudovirales phage]CAB4211785.1 hypothetical protein UFOVP1414_20 [uncultured Caudovirales phage]
MRTFTIQQIENLTEAQIELMSGGELAASYNALAQKFGVGTIKKFTDRPTGIKRLLAIVNAAKAAAAKNASKSAKPAKSAAKAERKASVSGTIQQLIVAGKSNVEIWGIIQPQFGLDESKKYYPAWNRSMMVRKGLTPQASA